MSPATVGQRVLAALAGRVPRALRRVWVGDPSHPRRLAALVHAALDGMRGAEPAELPCHGVLEGYRMAIDWTRHRHYLYGSWEPSVVAAMQRIVPAGGRVIDIGAHIGFFTLLLSRLVGPDGMVAALEPLPENRELLQANVRRNGCDNVRVLELAAGDAPGTASLGIGEEGPFPGCASVARRGGRVVTVNVTTVDDVVEGLGGKADFIKIDVEGAEAAVLAGASRTIAAHHPPLVVEVHGEAVVADRTIGLLERSGYRVFWLDRSKYLGHVLAR